VVVLRLLGLAVAVALALIALALLGFGFGSSVVWLNDGLRSFANWVTGELSPGLGVLVGVFLVLLALLAALVMLGRRPASLIQTEHTSGGSTWVDLRSVARSLEGRLRTDVDRSIQVRARRRGLRILAPGGPDAPFALADVVTQRSQDELATLGLAQVRCEVAVVQASQTRKESRVQ
jgi:hypothetical protein